jgi:cytochrome bd-type quinol oxidase subunit 2
MAFDLNAAVNNQTIVSIKSYDLLVFSGLAILLVSFFVTTQTIDEHIHDTYYIIGYNHILWVSLAFLLVLWVVYKTTAKKLFSHTLSWLHIAMTLFAISIILTLPLWTDKNQRRHMDENNWSSFNKYVYDGEVIFLAILMIFIAQVLLICNLVIGLLKK